MHTLGGVQLRYGADLPTVLPEQRASYSAIIDSILNSADLDTISAKAIRKELQAKVEYDLTEQKVSDAMEAHRTAHNDGNAGSDN